MAESPEPPAEPFDLAPVAHSYDRIAAEYAARLGEDLAQGSGDRAFVDVALSTAPSDGGPVLDLGCGPGQIAAIALADRVRAIGADISMGMLAVARRRSPAGAFLAADARQLPLATASCRAVAAFYFLHHLPRAALGPVLAELRRVLPRGGILVVATHLGSGDKTVTSERDGVTEHIRVTFYSKQELAAQIQAASFSIESVGSRLPRPDEFQAEHGFLRARAT